MSDRTPRRGNLGRRDVAVRASIGALLLMVGLQIASPWGMIGLLPVATATLGFCPLYALLGLDTSDESGTAAKEGIA